jgi:hypothetical protein
MRTFFLAFFGSFFGKIVAAIFIVICVSLGFGPHEWVETIIRLVYQLPNTETSNLILFGTRVLFLALGILDLSLFANYLLNLHKTTDTTSSEPKRIPPAINEPENTRSTISESTNTFDSTRVPAIYAMTNFADKNLLKILNETKIKLQNSKQRVESLTFEIHELQSLHSMSVHDPMRLNSLKQQLASAQHKLTEAQVEFKRSDADVNADIYKQLQDGRLVAKGKPNSYIGNTEVVIPPAEWESLKLDNTASGAGKSYIDITIGKNT